MVVLATVSIVALLTACGDGTSADNPDQAVTTETTKASDEFAAIIPVEGEPVGLAATGTSVWAALSDDYIEGSDALLRIDLATNEVVATIPLVEGGSDQSPKGVAATDSDVWVTTQPFDNVESVGTVERIDPTTNEIVATIPIDFAPASMTATDTAVWVIGYDTASESTLLRIDPTTNETTAMMAVNTGSGVAATDTAVWVTGVDDDGESGTVTRIDPSTNEVTATVPLDYFPGEITATDTAVWVADGYGSTVSRIDPATDEVVATVATADSEDVYISGLAITDTTVWAATGVVQGDDTGFDTMERAALGIDQATDEVTTTIPMGLFDLHEIAATESSVWLTMGLDGTLYRLDP